MTIEIELDGARRQVRLRREADGWLAAIDGREMSVSMAEAGGGRWSMLVGPAAGLPPEGGSHEQDLVSSGVSRKSYEIGFEPVATGELIVYVNGVPVPVTPIERRQRMRGGRAAGETAQPRTIVAPMPGRIVKVLVKPGEAVEARQGLVVVEAMKMENELRAPRAGTVTDVRVVEGASVEANTVLVVLR